VNGQKVRAVPGAGTRVPIWLLGSSLFSAQLAAHLGLPFAFAAHFAPDDLMQALTVYRTRFRPSRQLAQPCVMVGVTVFAADTDAEARRQFTSLQQSFINLRRGTPGPVPAPIDNIAGYGSEAERAQVDHALAYAVVGSPATVERGFREIIQKTQPDELMLAGHFYDHAARLRSFELSAQILAELKIPPASPASLKES
jgi:luciferase family oxidoreductase group 1